MAGGAQDDELFCKYRLVDCWVIHPPPLDFHGAGGRGRRPWPCERAPSSGTAAEGLYAAVEAMAGGAQDDDFF